MGSFDDPSTRQAFTLMRDWEAELVAAILTHLWSHSPLQIPFLSKLCPFGIEDREDKRIDPFTLDEFLADKVRFLTKTESFEHFDRIDISWVSAGYYAVEFNQIKPVGDDGGDGFGGISLPTEFWIEYVANLSTLIHIACEFDAHLADQPTGVLESNRQIEVIALYFKAGGAHDLFDGSPNL